MTAALRVLARTRYFVRVRGCVSVRSPGRRAPPPSASETVKMEDGIKEATQTEHFTRTASRDCSTLQVWGEAQAAPAPACLLRGPACPTAALQGQAVQMKQHRSRQAVLQRGAGTSCCCAAAAVVQRLRALMQTRPMQPQPARLPQPPARQPQSLPSSRRQPWAAPQKRPKLL